MPTIAGLAALLEALLAFLPANATTPAQRASWAALLAIVPPLPMRPNPANASGVALLAPAEIMCTAGSNPAEAPEMYAVHPYRRFTVGRQAAMRVAGAPMLDLEPARASFAADPLAYRFVCTRSAASRSFETKASRHARIA